MSGHAMPPYRFIPTTAYSHSIGGDINNKCITFCSVLLPRKRKRHARTFPCRKLKRKKEKHYSQKNVWKEKAARQRFSRGKTTNEKKQETR
jgi:hypothetical protein